MRIYENIGPENTDETLTLAINKAKIMNTDLVIASSSGNTALAACKKAEELSFEGKIVVVRLAYGSRAPGENVMSKEVEEELEAKGVIIITAAHVLSGAERGISKVYHTISPVELMADTLRMISRGIKVCVEIAVMALDAGAIPYGQAVVCVGGSGRGADAACVMTPEYAANILKTKVHEFICMPYD